MHRLTPLLFVLPLAGPSILPAQSLEPLPRELEVELARSALPSHLRSGATVYALDPASGFEVAVEGTNGFHALVVRNDPAFVEGGWSYAAFRNDLLIPIAFDAAGESAQLRVLFDVAAARAAGQTPEEVRRTMRERFRTGYYPPPVRAGISYMLSPILRAYRDAAASDEAGTFVYPHYMVYAPDVRDEDVGGGAGPGHPFVIEPGPHGYIVIPTGSAERDAIVAEHADLLRRVCALSADWCVRQGG